MTEYVYIYIYIYIFCHPQTDYFVVSKPFSVARHVGHFKLGSKLSELTLDIVSNCSAILATNVSSGIITHMYWLSFDYI